MTNTPKLFRSGDVGFIDWLDGLRGNLSASEDMMVNVQICQHRCRGQTDREDTVAGHGTTEVSGASFHHRLRRIAFVKGAVRLIFAGANNYWGLPES